MDIEPPLPSVPPPIAPPPTSLATTVWPVVAVLALLLAMTAAMVMSSLFAPPELVGKMVDGHIISRFITIFLIVPVIAVLCLRERITGEAAIAALSAIAGYILGGTSAN